jgi:hypothetical protein
LRESFAAYILFIYVQDIYVNRKPEDAANALDAAHAAGWHSAVLFIMMLPTRLLAEYIRAAPAFVVHSP